MGGVLHLRGLEIWRHVNGGERTREDGVSGGLEGGKYSEHGCGAWRRARQRREAGRMGPGNPVTAAAHRHTPTVVEVQNQDGSAAADSPVAQIDISSTPISTGGMAKYALTALATEGEIRGQRLRGAHMS